LEFELEFIGIWGLGFPAEGRRSSSGWLEYEYVNEYADGDADEYEGECKGKSKRRRRSGRRRVCLASRGRGGKHGE